ncbi:anti-sigma B factor antagonist [Thermotomaculum hydrothermale]|uniref:Anti-sigma factor antagonist n=1 Tax=Thermotomaculum hydrothermale TaxID=981385 RepID=A0A7R6PTX0_9BACT|nr:STAS domain-containing protein [Thermotomaculum hydrothermale]BBB32592.1 anti-sigma B factor antagonist [Thermotomaculum hydrothermale]
MLEIKERKVNDIIILDLKGKITIGEGDKQLREKITSLLEKGEKKIILNMARVSYLDSSGTGEVVSLLMKVKKAGGELKLLSLSQKIKDIFQIAQLLSIFDYYTDEEEALKAFE